MNRISRQVWIYLLVLSSLLSCQSSSQDNSEATEYQGTQPNVLVILLDDMGYADLGCYGSELETPHIDALAAGGLRMTQFYNAARCCPSRASLLTGLYPHQAGMGHQNQDKGLPSYRGRIGEQAVTIAEVLQPSPYTTYQVGKWHVGNEEPFWPGNKGFDQYFSLIEGAMSYYNQWPWVRNQDTLRMVYNGGAYRTDKHFFATDTFSDTAAAFIARHPKDQPFFMYLAYNAPHWPLHAKPEDNARFKGQYAMGWDSIRALRHQRMIDLEIIPPHTPLSKRFTEVPVWDELPDSMQLKWQVDMELYAAVMYRLDLGIGKVIRSLRESQQLEKTLILLLSDNGACHEDPTGPWSVYPEDGSPGSERSFPAYGLPWANVGNTPFRLFKSWLHEGGIRTPLIAYHPGWIQAGQVNHQTVGHIMDLMPTILELAGMEYPLQFEGRTIIPTPGRSLVADLLGQATVGHQTLFWEHQFNRAVRQDEWKLVAANKIPGRGRMGEWELYNLWEDPIEANNLALQYPEKVDTMAEQYAKWAMQVGAYEKQVMDSLLQKKDKQ